MARRTVLGVLVVLLVLAAVLPGCAPVPAEEKVDDEAVMEPDVVGAEPPAAAIPADFSYLNGVWTVTAELTEIDKGTMRDAADRPSQRWECTVAGSTLTVVTDTHTYTGPIATELDDAWVFTSAATLADEDGFEWTSTVEIHGKRTGDGLFAGTMQESLDSAEGGHEYAAEWRFEGRRQ